MVAFDGELIGTYLLHDVGHPQVGGKRESFVVLLDRFFSLIDWGQD